MTTSLKRLLTRGVKDTEKFKKEKARRNLCDFMEYDSGYNKKIGEYKWKRADHLELLAEKLEQVESGELRKLMVFIPPRHGKSELVSRKFPAWYLGRNPDKEIILTSYSADLAYDFSEVARNTVRELGKDVFDRELSSEAAAKKKWSLKNYRGTLKAAGVGGPITGRGANVAIIDDPIKNWEEANSKLLRDKIDKWYQSTLRTRLNPGGAIVLVMTRWHTDDLAGRLLDREGKEWEVFEFPAIAKEDDDVLGREEGEVLWPSRYPKEEILDIKDSMLEKMFGALYQQTPRTSSENSLWNYDMFQYTDELPDMNQLVVAVDPATSNKDESDETGIIVAGKAGEHGYVIEDLSCKASPNQWANTAVRAYDKYEADRIIAETNQGGDMVERTIKSVDKHVSYKEVKATRGKQTRAEPISALYEQGKIYHNGNFPDLEQQLTAWEPGDDSPDRLDALVWAFTHLFGKGRIKWGWG